MLSMERHEAKEGGDGKPNEAISFLCSFATDKGYALLWVYKGLTSMRRAL
jgi:hypothetical protein